MAKTLKTGIPSTDKQWYKQNPHSAQKEMLIGIITLTTNLAKSTKTELMHTLGHSSYTNNRNVYIVPKMIHKRILITALLI